MSAHTSSRWHVIAVTQAQIDVLKERLRQIEVEGWTSTHDDEHTNGGLATAAACYAITGTDGDKWLGYLGAPLVTQLWTWTGWARQWFKPADRRRNLVKAAALLIAEIERMDREVQHGQQQR